LRLSDAERESLRQRAGDVPISTYVKQVVLAGGVLPRGNTPKVVSQDRALAARALALLGSSHIFQNLSQLARAAEAGSLFVDDDMKSRLHQACADVKAMRLVLMHALGKEASEGAPAISAIFHDAARAGGVTR
jgi:hypothetical protein